ncbi:hypothetical protein ACFOVU_23725 [Nocardiopsis sediminis]|uniref:DUF4345 domain-containing protein n=1 Tax=Nocardiopsis sediminis TaxID=1778267 RepID=A0ABV8FVB9_9ACTN
MRAPALLLRTGLWFLGLSSLAVGLWQSLLPRSFFALEWVGAYPPYNDHLLRDVGGLNLALGVVVVGAAVVMERRMVITALLGYLTYAATHLLFHGISTGHVHPVDVPGLIAALGAGVLIPIGLLVLAWRDGAGAPPIR